MGNFLRKNFQNNALQPAWFHYFELERRKNLCEANRKTWFGTTNNTYSAAHSIESVLNFYKNHSDGANRFCRRKVDPIFWACSCWWSQNQRQQVVQNTTEADWPCQHVRACKRCEDLPKTSSKFPENNLKFKQSPQRHLPIPYKRAEQWRKGRKHLVLCESSGLQ